MSQFNRIASEKIFHDRQAVARAHTFVPGAFDLRFDDDAYLDHESWIRPAFSLFGDVSGKRVLDYGCGHAMAAIVLARRGASVTAMDVSHGYCMEADARSRANQVPLHVVQANGELLPFADGAFDCIWGHAILHHLDVLAAARELHRVLAPDGVAVLCEPWGENPLLNFARRRRSYSTNHHTPDETPLTNGDVALLRQVFPSVHVRGFQVAAMLSRVLGGRRLRNGLDRLDSLLLSWCPFVQRYCRYVVIRLRRELARGNDKLLPTTADTRHTLR